MDRILVTGATGELGRQTIERLVERTDASHIVALARDPAKAADIAALGVQVRQGEYDDPASLVRAFAGVDKLLLISTTAFSDAVAHHRNAIEAAKQAGVRHIHYTAIQHPEGSDFAIPQVTDWDRETIAMLDASGLEVTLLFNALYLDSLPFMLGDAVFETGVHVPAGLAPAALVARADLAEGNAVVLTTDGHAGRSYQFGGSTAVTMAEVAAILSDISGRRVDYADTPFATYVDQRATDDLPASVVEFFAEWFRAVGAGEFANVTGDLERLIGRPPITARDFLRDAYADMPAVAGQPG